MYFLCSKPLRNPVALPCLLEVRSRSMFRKEARMERWTRAVGSSLRDEAACAKGRDTFTPANIKRAAGTTEISLSVTCRVGGFKTRIEKEVPTEFWVPPWDDSQTYSSIENHTGDTTSHGGNVHRRARRENQTVARDRYYTKPQTRTFTTEQGSDDNPLPILLPGSPETARRWIASSAGAPSSETSPKAGRRPQPKRTRETHHVAGAHNR